MDIQWDLATDETKTVKHDLGTIEVDISFSRVPAGLNPSYFVRDENTVVFVRPTRIPEELAKTVTIHIDPR